MLVSSLCMTFFADIFPVLPILSNTAIFASPKSDSIGELMDLLL